MTIEKFQMILESQTDKTLVGGEGTNLEGQVEDLAILQKR